MQLWSVNTEQFFEFNNDILNRPNPFGIYLSKYHVSFWFSQTDHTSILVLSYTCTIRTIVLEWVTLDI